MAYQKAKFYSPDDPIPKEALAGLESDIRREVERDFWEAKYHELAAVVKVYMDGCSCECEGDSVALWKLLKG